MSDLDPPKVVEKEENKLLVNYDILTTYIIKKFCIISFKKIIYIYYNEMFREDEGQISKEIEKILISEGIADKKRIRETVNEVIARILWRTFFVEYPFNKLGNEFIPLKNGVLWRGTEYKLLPHSLAFGYTYRLPVKYNPEAEHPKIEKFISEIVSKENRQILYEIPASCLLQNPNYHYAYILVGTGSNGKSTYLKLIEKFLGKENISGVSLQELCEDRFKAAQLVGKLANIHADLPKYPLKYSGKFKILTGGDRLTVERKYKDPFEFTNTARLIFAANELPEVTDQSYAFWRRWIVVEFPNKFSQNPSLLEELTTEEELSGLLNSVLLALTRIEIRGQLTKTETVDKIMETWMKRANSVFAFVKDCIEVEVNSYETKDDVYECYVRYCESNDLRVFSKNIFGQELQKHVPGVKSSQKRLRGQIVRVWLGIKLKREYFEVGEEDEEDKEHDEWSLNGMFELT